MNVTLHTLRILCSSYPEVSENLDAVGYLSFRVRNRPFVLTDPNGSFVSVKVRKLTQSLLLERPGFERTPYIGRHGWTTVPIPDEGDGSEAWLIIRRLIHEGYAQAAPQRLIERVAGWT